MRLAAIALLALCAAAFADLESRYHAAQVSIWSLGGTNAFSRHSNCGLMWTAAEREYRKEGMTLYSVRLYERVAATLTNHVSATATNR